MSISNRRSVRLRSEAERRRAFFYAEADADLYDAAADLSTPLYSLMHHALIELVRQHRDSQPQRTQKAPFFVLDIGSGTGAESIAVLGQFPKSHVVALDLCEPMHALFRRKAEEVIGSEAAGTRCRYITGDVAGAAGNTSSLLHPLKEWGQTDPFDIVISALALHHLTTTEKRKVYGRIASVLKPGGLFVNGDLFTFQSPTMARMANQFGLNWIRKQFSTPDQQFKHMRDSLGKRASPMMQAWLDHYVNANLPDPIESSVDSGADTARGLKGQARMLVEAGFSQVACPFRYWEVGILWAKR